MSLFRERYGSVVCRRGAVEALLPEFRESYPAIAEVMGGVEAENGSAAILPHTLMLFWEGDRMKFCLNRSGSPTVCFGCVPDPLQALESIDKELREGRFEWKKRRG